MIGEYLPIRSSKSNERALELFVEIACNLRITVWPVVTQEGEYRPGVDIKNVKILNYILNYVI